MDNFNFDDAMKRLKVISDELSNETIEMDKALALFEEGLDLSSKCQSKLNEYEQRVNDLVSKHQGGSSEGNN